MVPHQPCVLPVILSTSTESLMAAAMVASYFLSATYCNCQLYFCFFHLLFFTYQSVCRLWKFNLVNSCLFKMIFLPANQTETYLEWKGTNIPTDCFRFMYWIWNNSIGLRERYVIHFPNIWAHSFVRLLRWLAVVGYCRGTWVRNDIRCARHTH